MASVIDTVVNLCKRRGLVYQAGEIYGGSRSAWDYGPLGVELKENIKRQWWRHMVQSRADVVGVDTSVIQPRQVWVSSGHVEVFSDPLVESRHTGKRYRADDLIEAYEEKHGHEPENGLADINDPETGQPGDWTEPKAFSGLLKTFLGPVDDEQGLHYLRPETAQGIFVNFKNVMTSSRMKPPFGIANIGKSFRNEITPGNFIFRTREFEQMEMEFFVKPGEDEEWHQYWIDDRYNWYVDLGIKEENLRLYEHPKEKLSHYSKRTVDVEYAFGFKGSKWGELEGVANRTDYDLSVHAKGDEWLRQDFRTPYPPARLEALVAPNLGTGKPLRANAQGVWVQGTYAVELGSGVTDIVSTGSAPYQPAERPVGNFATPHSLPEHNNGN
mgnify:CR=1 FL=1